MEAKKEENKPYSLFELVIDIWKYLKLYKGKFWLATTLRIISDLIRLYPAYAFGLIVTSLTSGNISIDHIANILLLLALSLTISPIAQYLTNKINYYVAERTAIDVEQEMMAILFARPISWHEKENTGNKIQRIESGKNGYNQLIRIWTNNVIETVIRFTGSIIIIAFFDIRVAIAMAIFLATYYTFSLSMVKPARRATLEVNKISEEQNGFSFEIINNVRSVKVLGTSGALLFRLNKIFSLMLEKIQERIRRFQRRTYFMSWYSQMVHVTLITVIITAIIHGHYAIGFLVTFETYFIQLSDTIRSFSDMSQEVTIAKQSIGRMFALIGKDREAIKQEYDYGTKSFPKDWKKLIVENVNFNYGEIKALEDLSFTVKRGEKIGVVGLSGAGKSTLFKLLLKEHSDYKGKILIDEISIENIKTESYLNHASVVLQDTEVFNFSLKDNITLVNQKEESNSVLLERALEVSHVSDFVHKLPDGVDTLIGEKGVKLSGGEKQRLGIARAIFKNPDILFMDEATSHLDLESEEKIRDSLHKFFENVTAVVIAHRLTTIREMDRILVIENGKLIEEGTFEQLQNKRGRFNELWEKQKFT